jgi:CMP/dCMP kinase
MAACYTCEFVSDTLAASSGDHAHAATTRDLIVAIDGPSGAGKGTIARAVAERLGYRHVDTGAMYRAVAWLARHRSVPLDAPDAVAQLAEQATLTVSDGCIAIDGHDVTQAIRTPEMDGAAASVARVPAVRRVLVERQRALAGSGGVVMEGRDIGTVVFPAADVKIYLDADPAERARRRANDPAHAGSAGPLAIVATAMADRDRLDTTRLTSPLVVADDAVRIDTTNLEITTVVERVLAIVDAAQRRRRDDVRTS